MSRKTIILTENQFNEICGVNTAYLDNESDYAEDGLTTTKASGAVSNGEGQKEYSEPMTGDDYSHMLSPETLFAFLFRNGGHGLWGHWGSGLRADMLDGFDSNDWENEDFDEYDDESDVDETDPESIKAEIERLEALLDSIEDDDEEDDGRKKYFNDEELKYLFEEYDGPTNDIDPDEVMFGKCLNYLRKTEFGEHEDMPDTLADVMDRLFTDQKFLKLDTRTQAQVIIRETMKKIDYEYYWEQYSGEPLPKFDRIFESKKKLQESNGELEDRTWRLDLDNDGLKKTYSYTNLTTKKTELKQLLAQLVQQNAPKQQIQRVKSALAGVCRVLDRETGTIKQRKTNRKNMGFENQFQKAGGTKNSGNGKAHSKKMTKDPNVGTGYITYA